MGTTKDANVRWSGLVRPKNAFAWSYGAVFSAIAAGAACHYSMGVNRLTRHEQVVLCAIVALLLIGLAVRTYRTAHPKVTATQANR